MSKGTCMRTFRLDEDMWRLIGDTVRNRNLVTRLDQWTISDFIREAINDKIAHMERSRKSRKRREADNTRVGLGGE